MSECDNCARARAGMWCGYSATCNDCTARAVARSITAFEAVRHRATADLRAMLARALPGMSYEAARDMVWVWWRLDHPKKGT